MSELDKAINDAARERVMEKVRKLLALARDSGASENEAATAARQAATMMNKYQIDAGDILIAKMDEDIEFARELAEANPRKRRHPFTEVSTWCGVIAMGVADLFDCVVDIVGLRDGGVKLRFSGHVTDVPVAVWTYQMLTETVYRLSTASPEASVSRAAKTAFRMGAAIRLQNRLDSMKDEQDRTNEECKSTGTSLVVIDKKKAAVKERFGESKRKKTRVKTLEDEAFSAGKAAGDKIPINRALTGGDEHKKLGEQKRLN